MYDQCPYSWYLCFKAGVEPLEIPPTPAVLLGRAFHGVIRSFLKGNDKKDRKTLLKLWRKRRVGWRFQKENMMGDMAIDNWWVWYQKLLKEGYELISAEEEYFLNLYGVKMKGFIDSIFIKNIKKHLVVDWKTGSYELKNQTQDDIIIKDSIQMLVYGKLVEYIYEIEASDIEIGLFFPIAKKFLSCNLTESVAEERIHKIIEGIEEENFTKRTENCDWCNYKFWCMEEGV
jgi:hypothetical protein